MKTPLLLLIGILAVTLLAYSVTLKNDFIYFDDDVHLLKNPAVRSLDAQHIRQMFTTTVNKIYIPATTLTFAVEYHFFKYQPFIYHLNNLLLHLGVIALIFYFALQLGLPLRAAAVGGLLFGIHPMHVESVAWVTERKDVLYAFFYMLALCSYMKYLAGYKRKYFIASVGFGLVSLLAKPMALSLPLMLFVCDWFMKREKSPKMFLEKIPYLLYIVPIAWITYSLHARIPGEDFGSGFLIWIWSFVFYIQKFLFPMVLVPMYALPEPVAMTNPHYGWACLFFVVILTSLIVWKKQRWLLFAAAVYFCQIFFLLRFDDITDKNVVADRFMYLPSLGICFLVGYGVDQLYQKFKTKDQATILTIGLVLVTTVIVSKTHQQGKLWGSNISFWSHELKYFPHNATALGNRGEAYMDLGKFDLAMNDFNQAIKADPNYPEGYNSRGQLYGMSGQTEKAFADFLRAVELKPGFSEAYNNLGIIYAQKQDLDRAAVNFKKALTLNPANVEARNNIGDFYFGRGDIEAALKEYRAILPIDPQSAGSYAKIGLIHGMKNENGLALEALNRSLAIDPRNSAAYKNRGIIFEHQNKLTEALADYQRAISLNPKDADAFYGRGNVFARTGQYDRAAKEFEHALKINPLHQGAKKGLAALANLIDDK